MLCYFSDQRNTSYCKSSFTVEVDGSGGTVPVDYTEQQFSAIVLSIHMLLTNIIIANVLMALYVYASFF